MASRMRLDAQDKAALRALDTDFKFNSDDTIATITGEMKLVVARTVHDSNDLYELRLDFPGGESLDIKILRARLIEQLDIEADDEDI